MYIGSLTMVWSSDEKKLTTQAYEVVNNKGQMGGRGEGRIGEIKEGRVR